MLYLQCSSNPRYHLCALEAVLDIMYLNRKASWICGI